MKRYALLATVILIATSAGVATAYFGDGGKNRRGKRRKLSWKKNGERNDEKH
ncbi:hypothetical protein KKA24_03220 [Patescibacteria group bacterium]|nr:hypothetical protein [Patescibacteria group bacterium]